MTRGEAETWLRDIRYKNGWRFIIGSESNGYFHEPEVLCLQVLFQAPDSRLVEPLSEHQGRKWLLHQGMTKNELVQTALMAVLAIEEHEAREQFLYRDLPIFCPHHNIDHLHLITAPGAQ